MTETPDWDDVYEAVQDENGDDVRWDTAADVEEWLQVCDDLQAMAKAGGRKYVEGPHGSIRPATFPDMRERVWSVIEGEGEGIDFLSPMYAVWGIEADAIYYILSREPVRAEDRDKRFPY